MLTHIEMISRIAIGAGLGGVIGFERDIHGRQVGLRTHLIVSMASATFMVISAHFAYHQGYDGSQHIEVDGSRIAASVVSGIGFLAGGAILKTGATIQGLTTAAGLWLVTAIGLCSGAGMFVESGAVTLMGLIALTFFRAFEDKNDQLIRRHVSLVVADGPNRVTMILQALQGLGARVSDFDYEKKIDDRALKMAFEAKIPLSVGVGPFIDLLEKQEGIQHVHVRLRE